MLDQLLKKLIRNSAGQAKFVLAVIGLSTALLLILSAVQLQSNYYELLNGKENQDSIANFLVINKSLTDQNVGASSLSPTQLNDLKKQSFTESIGTLTASRFKASIQSNNKLFPFYTDIAFESVPEEFIDVNTKGWHWDEQATYLPIIVPNQFLDFYNFQYSFSQNLPQLTPQVVKMVSFKVTLQGTGQSITMNGRVVGFSNRISSMLVPQTFMDWANSKFASSNIIQQPSRVIIKTKDPGNPVLTNYLKKEGLITDSDKTRFSRYRQVVDFVVNISSVTGLLMFTFALLIFSLFIQLTIASCKEEIELLILIGNSPKNIGRFLMKRFFPPNVFIVLIGLVIITIAQYFLADFLTAKQIILSSFISWYTIAAAILLLIVIAIVNYVTIQKYLVIKQRT
jgi:cell division protein FtsX